MRSIPLLLFGPILLTACPDDDGTPNPGGSGELGVGTFTYLCRGDGDFTCSIGQTSAGFPQAFVVDGRFGLSYAWKSETDHINEPLPALQSAAPEHLKLSGDTFTAVAPGYSAVLAVTGNTEIVDLIHASLRPVDDLRIVGAFDLPSLAPVTERMFEVGVPDILQLVPLDLNDVPLSGAVEAVWTSSDPAVVELVSGQTTGRVQLGGVATGVSTVSVEFAGKTASVIITVTEALIPTTGATEPTFTSDPTTTTATGTDTGTATVDTTGTGTGTGTDTGTDTGTTSATETTTDTTTDTTTATTTDTTGGAL